MAKLEAEIEVIEGHRLDRIETLLDAVCRTQVSIAESQDKLMQAMSALLQVIEGSELEEELQAMTLDGRPAYGERDQGQPL